MRKSLGLLCCACALCAQTLSAPIAGLVLDDEGRMLSIAGVPGNLLPGQPMADVTAGHPILAAGFSSKMGALKTASQVISVDANGVFQSSREAPAGSALFGFAADGTLQWTCFPGAHQLQSMSGSALLDISGWGDSIVALGPVNGDSIAVLVTKGSQLWSQTVDTGTGAISSQTPVNGSAPAVFFEGGWLSAGAGALLWQPFAGGGTSQKIPFPGIVLMLQNSGAHSVAVNGRWLLGSDLHLLEIPVPSRALPAEGLRPPTGRAR